MGLPPVSVGAVFGTWSAAPGAVALVAALLLGYLLAVARVGFRRWPRRRLLAWVTGLAVLAIALDSGIEAYAHVLLWIHMVQHLLLIMVVPVLLVWGAPVDLLASAGGPAIRRVVAGRAARVVTFPLLTLVLYAAVLLLTHLTGFQQAMTGSPGLRDLEQAAYLVTGLLFFLPLFGTDAVPWAVPYPLRLALLALSMGVDTLVGVALLLTRTPLAPAMAAMRPGWGPSALTDQGSAGAVMWVGGDALMMLLMVLVGVQWTRAEPDRQGFGRWLESARQASLAGLGHGGVPVDGVAASRNVDADDAALAAYNAMLADLHREDGAGRRS